MKYGLPLLLLIGLTIRFLLIPNSGFEADVAFWKSWSLAASDHGIVWMTQNTNNNYPPAFGYVLWWMGKLYSLLGDPHNFDEYWNAGNFLFLFVAKIIPILSDVGITLGIYYLLSHPELLLESGKWKVEDRNKKNDLLSTFYFPSLMPLLGAAMYFLHPVTILDGAWWGQVDAFGVLFLLLTLIALFKDKPGLAMFSIILGFLLKLQNIIYIPLLLAYIFRKHGIDGIKKAMLGGSAAWVLAILPFLFAKKMDTVFYLLGANADWFPWLSLHAYNIWWVVAHGDGMGYSDKFLLWGILTPKTIGLIFFSLSYLTALIAVVFKPHKKTLLVSLFFIVFAFYMLLTQSHERYIFPAFLFFPLLLPFVLESRKWKVENGKENSTLPSTFYFPLSKLFFIYWIILSLTATFNIHRTLAFFYPHNALPLLSVFSSIPLTIAASYINILLYSISFIFTASLVSYWLIPVIIFFACMACIAANNDYMKGSVSLSKLKTTGWSQEFASPRANMSVNSYGGPYTWSRLSSLYFFYPKGIGSHAKSELTYELRGKFTRFTSDYGIDTEANTEATVVFQLIGDKKILFTSKTMGRFDLPKHMDVNIKGINELKLVTLPTEDGNGSDHADWLNPILYK